MALIYCEYCGHEISDNASVCPNCGNVTTKSLNKKRKLAVVIIILLLVLISAVAAISIWVERREKDENNRMKELLEKIQNDTIYSKEEKEDIIDLYKNSDTEIPVDSFLSAIKDGEPQDVYPDYFSDSRETYGVAEALPRVADYERDTILSVMNIWNDCHNTYTFYNLNDIYADRLFYYSKTFSKDSAIKNKEKAINKFVDKYGLYSQNCSGITMKRIDSQTIRCDFTKTVHLGNNVRDYHAYLEMQEFGDKWRITRESDTTTDYNISKRRK